jgi:protein-tyrosine-phosphatase
VRADGDLVITVCDRAHEEVGGDLHWSIPDPVPAGNDAAFDRALQELDHRVSELAPRLIAS